MTRSFSSVQFFLFFAVTVVVLSVRGLFRCPIFCPFVRGVTTSDCPSVDLTSRAFFISCFLKCLNSLFRLSSVLLAQTDLLTKNCLCVSASLKRPISTKARLIFLNWPSTSSFSWLMKSKRGCRFQSIARFKTWLTDSQLLLVHILPVCVATSGLLRLSRIKVFSLFWKYLTKLLEIDCPMDSKSSAFSSKHIVSSACIKPSSPNILSSIIALS